MKTKTQIPWEQRALEKFRSASEKAWFAIALVNTLPDRVMTPAEQIASEELRRAIDFYKKGPRS